MKISSLIQSDMRNARAHLKARTIYIIIGRRRSDEARKQNA